MKKKLIICIPSLRLGGAAKIALNITEYFLQENVAVTILLTHSSAGDAGFKDIPAATRLIFLPQREMNFVFKAVYKANWLKNFFKAEQPDAVLAVRHDATVVAALGWKLALKPGKFFIREINPITRTLHRKKIMIWLLRSAYASATAVIANSKDVAAALISKNWLPGTRIHVVDNPVLSTNFFDKAAQANTYLAKAPGIPLLISIGRLEPMKDFATLIRAFKLVKEQIPCELVIIGEGTTRLMLEELIDSLNLRSYVRLPGAMENPYPVLKDSNLFVLSSKYEGFGNVIVEALALGIPVVATDCAGGPAYILNQGKFGKLVPVADVQRLADGIVQSLNKPAESDRLRRRAMDFSVATVGKIYNRIMFTDQ
ncbi:MAG: glycosyltransferase [Bacteroidota bacterium]